MKNVIILGATGSVGTSVLDVIRGNRECFRVTGLAARTGSDALLALAKEFPQAAVAVAGDDAVGFDVRLQAAGWKGTYYAGIHAPTELVRLTAADVCVAAVSGLAGIEPAFAAAERGLRILLANKEVLVSAGRLFLDAAAAGGAEVLPLDSEHCALWQCLHGRDAGAVERVIITASGGPFRTWPEDRMARATREDAVRHPVWSMGAKISVDSATMANKALEVMEAHHLFGLALDDIQVLVHPQSVVHGMVEFVDGSIFAHMGVPDMRQPIACMLHHPEQRPTALPRLDLARIGRLDFEMPDMERFPLLRLGLDAARRGGGWPAYFNAANETAVALFLDGAIPFGALGKLIAAVMDMAERADEPSSLADVAELHHRARCAVLSCTGKTDAP